MNKITDSVKSIKRVLFDNSNNNSKDIEILERTLKAYKASVILKMLNKALKENNSDKVISDIDLKIQDLNLDLLLMNQNNNNDNITYFNINNDINDLRKYRRLFQNPSDKKLLKGILKDANVNEIINECVSSLEGISLFGNSFVIDGKPNIEFINEIYHILSNKANLSELIKLNEYHTKLEYFRDKIDKYEIIMRRLNDVKRELPSIGEFNNDVIKPYIRNVNYKNTLIGKRNALVEERERLNSNLFKKIIFFPKTRKIDRKIKYLDDKILDYNPLNRELSKNYHTIISSSNNPRIRRAFSNNFVKVDSMNELERNRLLKVKDFDSLNYASLLDSDDIDSSLNDFLSNNMQNLNESTISDLISNLNKDLLIIKGEYHKCANEFVNLKLTMSSAVRKLYHRDYKSTLELGKMVSTNKDTITPYVSLFVIKTLTKLKEIIRSSEFMINNPTILEIEEKFKKSSLDYEKNRQKTLY